METVKEAAAEATDKDKDEDEDADEEGEKTTPARSVPTHSSSLNAAPASKGGKEGRRRGRGWRRSR